jgi:hypothetical protein
MTATGVKQTHWAAVYDQLGTISIKVIDVETPGPEVGEVLIKL